MHVFSLEDFSFVTAFTDTRAFLLNFFMNALHRAVPDLGSLFKVLFLVSLLSLVLALKIKNK